jgi:hypothetical protein
MGPWESVPATPGGSGRRRRCGPCHRRRLIAGGTVTIDRAAIMGCGGLRARPLGSVRRTAHDDVPVAVRLLLRGKVQPPRRESIAICQLPVPKVRSIKESARLSNARPS